MTPQRRKQLWILGGTSGVALVCLGVYFVHIGLDRSNTLSGVLGFFASLVGLAISILSLLQVRPTSPTPTPQAGRMSQQSGANSINLQSSGDINIGDSNKLGGN
ncbi:hypothetical protein ACWERI_38505 [Streptomyces collinus]